MFGNRGYRWKLGAALALIALLGVYAGNRGDTINPSVSRCVAELRRWDGVRIWVPGARIVAVHDRDYEIQTGLVQIRVAGPAPAPAESRISLIAIFHGDGPVLEPVHTRILPAGGRFRLVMELVSVLVALAVFANFARHFLFRPGILQAEGRAD
ncbi:MAG TPA: hypothetical protein VMU54_17920 [Planctomycetota bacterium]|nr:hypothetical protein [Planctomycetota bacterium]